MTQCDIAQQREWPDRRLRAGQSFPVFRVSHGAAHPSPGGRRRGWRLGAATSARWPAGRSGRTCSCRGGRRHPSRRTGTSFQV